MVIIKILLLVVVTAVLLFAIAFLANKRLTKIVDETIE